MQCLSDIPECMSTPQIQQATAQEDHLQQLKGYIIVWWLENQDYPMRDENILDILRWHGSYQWDHNEGQACYCTWNIKSTSTKSTLYQAHGDRKDQTPGTQICILG